MHAGVRGFDHRGGDAKDLFNPLGCEDFGGGAVGHNPAAAEHQDLIREARSEVEVVHDPYGHHIRGIRETPYPLHEIDLVTNVEERQWLVQEKIATRSNIVTP